MAYVSTRPHGTKKQFQKENKDSQNKQQLVTILLCFYAFMSIEIQMLIKVIFI